MRKPANVTDGDLAKLRDLTFAISRADLSVRTPVLQLIADPLRDLLRCRFAGGFGFESTPDGVRCAFLHSQMSRAVFNDLNAWLATTPAIETWALYNPLCPARPQRNRAMIINAEEWRDRAVFPVLAKHGIARYHARILVSEGASLLAWVGGFHDDPPVARETWLLAQIAAPLQQRLLVERRLAFVQGTSQLLELALEQIGRPAFIVAARGSLLHANAAANTLLEQEGPSLVSRLGDAVRSGDAEFEVHATTGTGSHISSLLSSAPKVRCSARSSQPGIGGD